MKRGRLLPLSLVFAHALVGGACVPDSENPQGAGGSTGAGGVAGAQGTAGGPAGSAGANGGPGGAGGGLTGLGGVTGVAGTSGAAGTTGSGGSTGSGGTDGMAGGSGSTGTAGTGQVGRGGNGGGGAVAGRGGGPGAGGLGGRGGASGAGGTAAGGAGGSGGAGTTMRSAGCGKPATLTSGSRTIGSRSYILRIPDNYDNSHAYRLIFGYHWVGGTMQDVDGGGSSGAVWSYYGLRAQANNSTIFVAPQGISNGWSNGNGDDVEFTDDMIKLIEGDLCVDTTKVFALGFSFGGAMSYALACARPTVFRAVAVYSGGTISGCTGGTEPIAYLGIHGIGDGTLPISGGRSMRDKFVMNNGCTAQNPPEPKAGSATHTCTTYQGCRAGYPVEWCAFDGGHTPGIVDGGGDDGARTWTKTEAWKFFSQFQ